MNKRFWEIDFLRGLAIIMMVIYHVAWDLIYFFEVSVNINQGPWKIFQSLTASLFIFLVGVSSFLSYQRKRSLLVFLKRGTQVFSFGLLISLVTWYLFPDEVIVFGILHLIGVTIVLTYFFQSLRYLNLVFGFLFIFIGSVFRVTFSNSLYLLPFGIVPETYASLDYFPIFPWLGIALVGIFWAQLFYENNQRNFDFNLVNNNFLTKSFEFLGKKSLLIYLIHQPILFLVFYLAKLLIY
ncbi:hypothetical protein C0584_03720 [Candidatus Parcubacteria bacterium]|nr:MAG: hypothetical protein C0584_03720 [Candidatus Parcubacteria bacterium]